MGVILNTFSKSSRVSHAESESRGIKHDVSIFVAIMMLGGKSGEEGMVGERKRINRGEGEVGKKKVRGYGRDGRGEGKKKGGKRRRRGKKEKEKRRREKKCRRGTSEGRKHIMRASAYTH